MKYFTLNRVFIAYAIVFLSIISGVLPRQAAIPTIVLLLVWSVLAPLEEATLLFIRSVPLFIAIPLTASYDNLNMWRPLALVLFARMLWEMRHQVRLPNLKTHSVTRRLLILLVLAGLSLIGAAHPLTGAIRIVYFVNLSMMPIVLYTLVRQGRLTTDRVFTNLAIPTIIVVAVGYLQLISTYLIDVYQFMRLWGEEIQFRQFGTQWSYIAIHVGNTWLAYYGSQLSLRVFSLFPDSHSFPTFVLLGIPALFTLSRRYQKTLIPLSFLIVILSGTRGIWAASVGALLLALILWRVLRRREMFIHARWLGIFFALFVIAWPIFISPQFLLGKADWGLFSHRIKSVVDFGETS